MARRAFFEAVAPYDFVYFGFVINKSKLYSEGFKQYDTFYKFVCRMIFENAAEYLTDAIVKMDKYGARDFQRELSAYLKRHLNDEPNSRRRIKKVTSQNSAQNNLLQLVDMVCGAIARSYRKDRKDADFYRKIIMHREILVQLWPPE